MACLRSGVVGNSAGPRNRQPVEGVVRELILKTQSSYLRFLSGRLRSRTVSALADAFNWKLPPRIRLQPTEFGPKCLQLTKLSS